MKQTSAQRVLSPRQLPSGALLWPIAVALTFAGFRGLLSQPVVGDDLVFITYGGLGLVWGGSEVGSLFSTWIGAFVDSNHVTPLSGFIYALQMVLIAGFADMGLPPSTIWGCSRIAWISLALLAVSYFLRELLGCPLWSKSGEKPPLVALYLLNFAVLLGLLQMHGPWGYNPVLSYSIAGWGTTALGFLYLGLIFSWWGKSSTHGTRRLWLISAVGVAGFLLYELFLAFVLTAGVVLALLALKRPRRMQAVAWLRASLIGIVIPILAFTITQIVRMSMPAWYAGTTVGFGDLVIPVTATSSISSLPLMNLQPLQRELGVWGVVDVQVPVSASVILVSLVVSLFVIRVTRLALKPSPFALLIMVASFAVLLTSSNLIFAVSSKYQMELGDKIGHVYLAYVPSAMVLVSCLSLLCVLASTRFGRVGAGIGVGVLLIVAVPQLIVNRAVDQAMFEEWGWTSSLVDALNTSSTEKQRCDLTHRLDTAPIPLKQKASIAVGLDMAYGSKHSGQNFCSTWTVDSDAHASLTMK